MVFIMANGADSDEVQRNVAFRLGLHSLPKYIQYTKVNADFWKNIFHGAFFLLDPLQNSRTLAIV